MALGHDDDLGVYLSAVHHHVEGQRPSSFLSSYNGNGLSCLHAVARFHHVLRVSFIYGLKSVVVSQHYRVAVSRHVACESHRSVKHRLHGIAFLGGYLHLTAVHHLRLSHGQRERVVAGAVCREVYGKRVRVFKQPGRLYLYLLSFDGCKLVLYSRCQHQECNVYT